MWIFYSQFLLLASEILGVKEMCFEFFGRRRGWMPCIVDLIDEKNLKDGMEGRF